MGDLTTVDGLKAELVRAVERGDAARAADREFFEKRFAAGSDGTWRWATDMWNSDAG